MPEKSSKSNKKETWKVEDVYASSEDEEYTHRRRSR